MKRLNRTRPSMDTWRAVLLTVSALFAGCGDQTTPSLPASPLPPSPSSPPPASWMPSPPDLSLFDLPICSMGGLVSTRSIKPAKAVDYYELQSKSYDCSHAYDKRVHESSGLKCGTAVDIDKCNDVFYMLKSKDGDGFRHPYYLSPWYYFAVTAGDTVAVESNLLQFLGTIDTPQEALLVAWGQNYDIACGNLKLGAVRKVAEGYEVIATWYDDKAYQNYRGLLLVTPAGDLQKLWSEVFKP